MVAGHASAQGLQARTIDVLDQPSKRRVESTLSRVYTSRHLAELRHVLYLTIPIGLISIIVGWHELDSASRIAFAGAVLSACVGIVVWVYQTANDWLGLIDLFSGEISTLCRVCTISDVVQRYAMHLDNPDDPAFAKVAPSEIYTIIFDSNSRQLSVFDQSVIRHVTQFYTYIKAFRDATRALVALHEEKKPTDPQELSQFKAAWRGTIINNIFVLFLALDSGRKAIDELVEDERLSTEWVITILLSELDAFAFLLDHRHDDFRGDRLKLRYKPYRPLKEKLLKRVDPRKPDNERWYESEALIEALKARWALVKQARHSLPRHDP